MQVYLQEGAEVLKKAMQKCRDIPVEGVLLLVAMKLDSILATFTKEQRHQNEKHVCHKCGMKLMKKCLSCEGCGVRYCSQSCQKDDWDAHKVVCRRPTNDIFERSSAGPSPKQASRSL